MKINEDFEINNYEDYKKHKKEVFDITPDTIELCIKETSEKNPTFLIPNYDKLAFKLGDKIYIIPIGDNKPLKVIFQ